MEGKSKKFDKQKASPESGPAALAPIGAVDAWRTAYARFMGKFGRIAGATDLSSSKSTAGSVDPIPPRKAGGAEITLLGWGMDPATPGITLPGPIDI